MLVAIGRTLARVGIFVEGRKKNQERTTRTRRTRTRVEKRRVLIINDIIFKVRTLSLSSFEFIMAARQISTGLLRLALNPAGPDHARIAAAAAVTSKRLYVLLEGDWAALGVEEFTVSENEE